MQLIIFWLETNFVEKLDWNHPWGQNFLILPDLPMKKCYSSIEQLNGTDGTKNDTEDQVLMMIWFLAGREKVFPARPVL